MVDLSKLAGRVPAALGAVEEGLLRQQALGGVMYEQAAGKESARVSGAIKQEEQQIEALQLRYEQAATIAQDANQASLDSPPEYNEKGEMISGGAQFSFASRAMGEAKSAWNDLARRTGMEIKEVPVDYEPSADLIIDGLRKTQKGTLRDLIKEAQSGKISGHAKTTINNLMGNLDATSKKGVEEALIRKLKAMDPDEFKDKGLDGAFPRTGKEALPEYFGLPADVGASLLNYPGQVLGSAQEWWTGEQTPPPFQINDPFMGREWWRGAFGDPESRYGGEGMSLNPFKGLITTAEEAEARAKQRQGSSGL
jgi:hypothetical protein